MKDAPTMAVKIEPRDNGQKEEEPQAREEKGNQGEENGDRNKAIDRWNWIRL
jgi:hypothetical protein